MTDPSRHRRTAGRGRLDARERAQTTLDFAVGVGVFLVAVAFVVSFIPGMLLPFEDGIQEETVAVDRVATALATNVLAVPSNSYVLDRPCTVEFFRTTPSGPPPDCEFDQTTDLTDPDTTLADRVNVDDRSTVHVELRGDLHGWNGVDDDGDNDVDEADESVVDTFCYDVDSGEIVLQSDPDCTTSDVVFAIGETPPTNTGSVVTARRYVAVGEANGFLLVRAW